MIEQKIPNIAKLTYDPSTHIVEVTVLCEVLDVPETIAIIEATRDITGDDNFVILSDFSNVDTITLEARRLFSEKDPRLYAVATVINSVAKVLMINLMAKLFSFGYKFKHFSDKDQALAWLNEQLKELPQT